MMAKSRSLGCWLPLVAIAAALAGTFALDLHSYLTMDALARHQAWLMRQVEANALLAAAAYVTAYAAATALSLPGASLLTILGGFLFGLWLGTGLVVVSATLGAIGIFLAARTALGEQLRTRAGPRLTRVVDGLRDDAFSYLLALRLIPVFPFWLVNLAPALVGVRLGTYTAATMLGIIPGSFVYVSIGNGLDAIVAAGGAPSLDLLTDPAVIGPMAGLALLSLLPVAYRRFSGKRTQGA
jgi:uncharacterized membrane protein YdjX (TVP38/TMEM64 family)